MRITLMIEGQESVTWPQWVAIASACESAGLDGLFRSDHYASVHGRTERSSLDAWGVLAALGPLTSTIQLGTMVSPTSFRHPSVLAKLAVTADHTSGGRVELGLGAGWQELEHRMYGFPFEEIGPRYDELTEQVGIISRQLTEESFDHRGDRYTLLDCQARPKPLGPLPLIIGAKGGPRSAALAARHADEYNTSFPTLAEVATRKAVVDAACAEAGRDPLPFSVMTGCILGSDDAEVSDRAGRLREHFGDDEPLDAWLQRLDASWVIGTPDRAASRLEEMEAAGVARVMLQHQLHEDLDMVELMGQLG